MRTLSVLLVAILGQGVLARDGAACDRATTPLEDPAVAAAVADVVAVVDVTAAGGGSASVVVKAILKGSAAKGDKLVIGGLLGREEAIKRDTCSSSSVEVGKSYIVMLWSPVPGATKYDLVEPSTSVLPHERATQAAITAAVAKPHPSSAWQASASGMQTRLVLDPHGAKGEVDLFVLARNTGSAAVDVTQKRWPEAPQTKCALRIVDGAKRPVDARDVPIAKQDIAAYFSKNPGDYKVKVDPGKSHLIRLSRVTTAAPGWGYEEELGFKYYPVQQHGLHTVSADCVNVLGPGTHLTTSDLVVGL